MRACVLLLSCLAVAAAAVAGAAAPQSAPLEIGLALIAIDAKLDHLRISEGLRVSNPGPPVVQRLEAGLPPGARYVTFDLGLHTPAPTADGFSDSMRFPTGITEIVYSYALPAERHVVVARAFPFLVRRMEIVVRGPGVALSVHEGAPLPPMSLGGEEVRRAVVRALPAGSVIHIALDGLPVTRTWIPTAAAAGMTILLAGGLIIAFRRGS